MLLKQSVLGFSVLAALTLSAGSYAVEFDSLPASSLAKGLLTLKQNALAVQAVADDSFSTTDVITDPDGTEHVRMQRRYRGLPVIGGDVVVHSRSGKFRNASLSMKSQFRPDLAPKISADSAIAAVATDFDGEVETAESRGLVIYARDMQPVLAYEIYVEGASDTYGRAHMRYFVDATSGKLLDHWNLFQTAATAGTGKSLLVGNVGIIADSLGSGGYQLIDPSRGNGSVYDGQGKQDTSANLAKATLYTDADNVWGNNTETDRATVAADIAYGVSATWDYYKNIHGRNGIKNDGKGVKSYAHVQLYTGSGYTSNNAAWNGSAMEYGDGGSSWYPLVAVDVAGHEMSHGVTAATAGLAYSKESGGLNEGTSDILGTMVEYYANNSNEPPNYLIGEKIYRNNPNGTTALRYMFKPSLDGASADCWSKSVANLDVHYSSGVANHFYYLLAEGAVVPAGFGVGSSANLKSSNLVCDSNTTAGGIGRDAAQKIWYRALTVYMTSTTNYAGARTATLAAATDLYGSTSSQYKGVASAWTAVSVN